MSLTRSDFAAACVMQGYYFGVNPHYLMAVAQLRSQIGVGPPSFGSGPYDVPQSVFDADSLNLDLEVVLDPEDIVEWPFQVIFAANSALRHQNELLEQLGAMPSAVQLYKAQWPAPPPADDAAAAAADADLTVALDEALTLTAGDIGTALADVLKAVSDAPATLPDSKPLQAAAAPVVVPSDDTAAPTPQPGKTLFQTKAPWVMRKLLDDFPGLNEVTAAAILGNIGHECGGFRLMQEIQPRSGAGGFGWCQWTGTRRTAFFDMCKTQGLAAASDLANYSYLKKELTGSYNPSVAALKPNLSLTDAVRVFEETFERAAANAKHYDRRLDWANVALDAFHANQKLQNQTLPDAVRALLDPDSSYAVVEHAVSSGIDYWLVDEVSVGGGQVLIRQAVHARPEVVVRDTVIFPLQPSVAALPQVAAIPAVVKAALSGGVVAGPSVPRKPTGKTAARVSASVLEYAKRCDETLISRTVPGTNNGRRACAWAVNKVVETALGSPIGGGLSTLEMAKVLATGHKRLTEDTLVGGAIVISATNGGRIGHVGIVGTPATKVDQTVIYSNSSKRGIFSHYYTVERWKAYYGARLGLEVQFYQI